MLQCNISASEITLFLSHVLILTVDWVIYHQITMLFRIYLALIGYFSDRDVHSNWFYYTKTWLDFIKVNNNRVLILQYEDIKKVTC